MAERYLLSDIRALVRTELRHLVSLGPGVSEWIFGLSGGDRDVANDALRLARSRSRDGVERVLERVTGSGQRVPWWWPDECAQGVSRDDALMCLRLSLVESWAQVLADFRRMDHVAALRGALHLKTRTVWWVRQQPDDVPSVLLRGLARVWSAVEPDPVQTSVLGVVTATDENRWWRQLLTGGYHFQLEAFDAADTLLTELEPAPADVEREVFRLIILSALRRHQRNPDKASQLLAQADDVLEQYGSDYEGTPGERVMCGISRIPLVVLKAGSVAAVKSGETLLASLPSGMGHWFRGVINWQLVIMTDTWQTREQARAHAAAADVAFAAFGDRWLLPAVRLWMVEDALQSGDEVAALGALERLASITADGGPIAQTAYCKARALLAADAPLAGRWLRAGNLVAERTGRRALLRRSVAEEVSGQEVDVVRDGSRVIDARGGEVVVGASTLTGALLRALLATALRPQAYLSRDDLEFELAQWRVDNRVTVAPTVADTLDEIRRAGVGEALVEDDEGFRLLGVRVVET
jgi:hypothetical protein